MRLTIAQILEERPVVSDGAWGTELQKRGLPIGVWPDAWNLMSPEKVEEVAKAYVEAGARIILTNTFGANRFILGRQNLSDKLVEINRCGVEISKRAAGAKVMVFASIGPSGLLPATGAIDESEISAGFEEQASALAAAGADGLVLETMYDLTEAKLAVAAAKKTGLPVVACMSFDSGENLDRTLTGVAPEHAAETLLEAGADVIGANCGQGISGMIDVCRRLRNAAGVAPVWIKANAGFPSLIDGKAIYSQTPEEYASFVPKLIEAGAAFIGGCCGTSPEFIRAIRETVDRFRG